MSNAAVGTVRRSVSEPDEAHESSMREGEEDALDICDVLIWTCFDVQQARTCFEARKRMLGKILEVRDGSVGTKRIVHVDGTKSWNVGIECIDSRSKERGWTWTKLHGLEKGGASMLVASVEGRRAELVLHVKQDLHPFVRESHYFRTDEGNEMDSICSSETLERINRVDSMSCSSCSSILDTSTFENKRWTKLDFHTKSTRSKRNKESKWKASFEGTVSKKSFFLHTVKERWKTMHAWTERDDLDKYRRTMLPSTGLRERYGWISFLDLAVRFTIDGTLGILFLYVCTCSREALYGAWERTCVRAPGALSHVIRRLMEDPGGLKLHEETSFLYGNLILYSFLTWLKLVSAVIPFIGYPSKFIVVATLLFGGLSSGLALMHDVLVFCAWPLIPLHAIFSTVYQWQLKGILYAWMLVRGKRKNKVAGRPDIVVEYLPLEHVIAGVLLLAPLLLIMPTTALFYVFVYFLVLMLEVSKRALRIATVCLHSFPTAWLGAQLIFPCLFPSGPRISLVKLVPGQQEEVIKISSNTMSPTACLGDFKVLLREEGIGFLSSPQDILWGLLTGQNIW